MRRLGSEAWVVVAVAVAALGLSGCKHVQSSSSSSDVAASAAGSTTTVNGEVRKSFDLNGDGKPDAFEYYAEVKDEKGGPSKPGRLLRKEFDLNLDGKIDFWRWYDDKENVVKEALDVDFDGKVDRVNYFEKGQRVRQESDFTDDKPHKWIYYEKNAIARVERDLHGNGKPDYFEYWEGGVVDRIGIDRKGTGSVDFWERNPDTAESK